MAPWGMIIGIGGETIDDLTRWLTVEFETAVKIELKESQLWNGISDESDSEYWIDRITKKKHK